MAVPRSAPEPKPTGGARERRRHRRHTPMEIVAVVLEGDNGGLLVDLSASGAAVQAVTPLAANSDCLMHFQLPRSDTFIKTSCTVAWADAHGRAGLRLALPARHRRQVKDWLDAQDKTDVPALEEARRDSTALADAELPVPAPTKAATARNALDRLPALVAEQQLDLDATLQLVCERTRLLTGGTGCAIALKEQQGVRGRASSGLAPDVGVLVQMSSGLSWLCVSTAQVIRCQDTETDVRVNSEACRALNLRSAVLAPLLRRDSRVVGLLEVLSSRPHAFTEADVLTVQLAADLIIDTMERGDASRAPARVATITTVSAPQAQATQLSAAKPPRASATSLPAAARVPAIKRAPEPTPPEPESDVATLRRILQVEAAEMHDEPRAGLKALLVLVAMGKAALVLVAMGLLLWLALPSVYFWVAGPKATPDQTAPAGDPVEAAAPAASRAAAPRAAAPRAASDPGMRQPLVSQPRRISGPSITIRERIKPRTAPPTRNTSRVGHVTLARPIERVQPTYPQAALKAGIQGEVVLDLIIGKDGRVTEVRTTGGHPVLVQAAREATLRWRYSPFLLDGQPAEATSEVVIGFILPR